MMKLVMCFVASSSNCIMLAAAAAPLVATTVLNDAFKLRQGGKDYGVQQKHAIRPIIAGHCVFVLRQR